MRKVGTSGASVYSATLVSRLRAELGESPLWDPAVGFRWVDVPGRRLFTRDRSGAEYAVALSDRVTAVELGPKHRLLAVTSTGFSWLDPDGGRIEQIAVAVDDPDVSMNDGAIDARGRCWAGSAARDDSARGVLYRLVATEVTEHVDGIGMSNGIDWSPAGDVLYHVDSTAGTVMAWDYDLDSGRLGSARVLCSVASTVGMPDGLTVDSDGGIWVAVWGLGQVWRLNPDDGEISAIVEVPTTFPTSCAFGGEALSTLYVTTADYEGAAGGGLLYAVEVPVTGRLSHRFAGLAGDPEFA